MHLFVQIESARGPARLLKIVSSLMQQKKDLSLMSKIHLMILGRSYCVLWEPLYEGLSIAAWELRLAPLEHMAA